MKVLIREVLTNEIVETTSADVLIEDFYSGQPVIISFGFVDWNGSPGFDFFGRVKKLESSCDQPLNKIYLRDRTASWYQNGVRGLGSSVSDVAANLNTILHHLRPSRVVTIGQSMGAYGALLLGFLLRANQIVTFGGLSAIDPKLNELWNDHRYLPTFRSIQQYSVAPKYLDLLHVLRDEKLHGYLPDIDIYFGTFPSDVVSMTEVALNHGAVHVDALHAERIGAAYPKCRLHPYPQIGHLIAQHLVNTREMDAILRRHILGEESE